MNAPEFPVFEGLRDLVTVKRVYGDPYEKNGLTVIPAATVRGGGGGGRHGGDHGEESGDGGGLGVTARPSGAWIIHDGEVTWKPAVDPNRIVLGGQIVGLVALLVTGRLLGRRPARSRPGRRLLVLGSLAGLRAFTASQRHDSRSLRRKKARGRKDAR
jgi:hypothetical protein